MISLGWINSGCAQENSSTSLLSESNNLQKREQASLHEASFITSTATAKEAVSLAFSEVNPNSLKQTGGGKKQKQHKNNHNTYESEITLKYNSKDTLVPVESKYKPDAIYGVIVEKIAQSK